MGRFPYNVRMMLYVASAFGSVMLLTFAYYWDNFP